MEGAKKILVNILVIAAGVAAYDLLFKPMINKAKTALPTTAA